MNRKPSGRRTRRFHSPASKAKVALAALHEDIHVGRCHLGTLMQRMGIAALCPQPGTSERHPPSTRSAPTCCARRPSAAPSRYGR